MSRPIQRAAVVALLVCGALLWLAIGNGRGLGAMRWGLLVLSLGIGALPPVRTRVCALLEYVRHPSQGVMERTALLIGVLATAYFTFTAFNQDRDLFPKTH